MAKKNLIFQVLKTLSISQNIIFLDNNVTFY